MKTHYFLTLISIFFLFPATRAQVEWVTQSKENPTGTSYEGSADGKDIAIGQSNEVYVVGKARGKTTFDTVTVDVNTVVALARYEDHGRIKWVNTISGNSNNDIHAVATDDSNHVYVAGEYVHTNVNSILNFGNMTLMGNGSASTFIAKATSDGEFLWAVRILATDAPSSQYVIPVDMQVAPNGDVIVLGNVMEPVEIEGQMYNTTTGDNEMLFLARFRPDGSLVWFRNTTTFGMPGGHIEAAKLAIGRGGQLYVNGLLKSAGVLWGTDTLSARDGTGQFLARFDSNGDIEWWRTQSARTIPQYPHEIGVDAQDNVYITMRITGGTIFWTDTTLIPSHGFLGRRLLMKFSPAGERLFAKAIGKGEFPSSGGISDFDMTAATLANGTTFITGMYGGNGSYMTFGDTDTVPMPSGFAQERQFMVAFYANGNYKDVGFMINEYLSLPDVDFTTRHMVGGSDGKLHMAGQFRHDYRLGMDTLRTLSTLDQLFLLKLDPALLLDLTTAIGDIENSLPSVGLFPNPTTDRLHIFQEDWNPQRTLHTMMYSLSGQVLRTGTMKQEGITWEVNDLPSGTYVVVFREEGRTFGKKVVISKR